MDGYQKKLLIDFGGIAKISMEHKTGVLCLFPFEDAHYNPNIDINLEYKDYGLYSIPVRYYDKVFCVLQFTISINDLTQYRHEKSIHSAKLDPKQEKILEVAIEAIIGGLENLEIN